MASGLGTISRKSSFSHRRMMGGKPRSLSTCPTQATFFVNDDVNMFSTDAFIPNRKNSLNIESPFGSDDHIGLLAGDVQFPLSLVAGEEHGTRRARSNTSARKTLFFNKDKLNAVLEKIHPVVIENRLTRSDLTLLELESHWTDLVISHKELTKRACDEQEAIWEVVTTERRYINLLQNMEDLALCLMELQKQHLLRDVNIHKVFLNYGDLLRCNLLFWKKSILPMLNKSRETGEPLKASLLFPGFENIVEWSQCYIEFNVGHAESYAYIQKKQKESELFSEFVRWAEAKTMVNRQKLADTLTTPMQRLTRYSLLLKAIMKAVSDSEDKDAIQDMINFAEAATARLNYELNNNDLRIQLAEIMKTIESYEVIDHEEYERLFQVRSAHHLNLMNPMPGFVGPPKYRRMYTKGDLKLREGRQGAKQDVHCILFTDMFLICKPTSRRADRLRVTKAPMHIDSIFYHPFPEGNGFYLISMNEFHAAAAFLMFFTAGTDETRRWLEMIAMAQEEWRRLRDNQFEANVLECERQRMSSLKKDIHHRPGGPLQHHQSFSSACFGANGAAAAAAAAVSHRKSHSMDSQLMAVSRPGSARMCSTHAYHLSFPLLELRKADALASAEQLDRHESEVPSTVGSSVARSIESFIEDREMSNELSEVFSSLNTDDDSQHGTGRSSDDDKTTDPPVNDEASCSTQPPEPSDDQNGDASSISSAHRNSFRGAIAAQAGRRFEKRYHTVGEIDTQKPPSLNGPPGILKRFSWNVSSAMSGSSRRISAKFSEMNSRRFSQSTAGSNDSFGSSTSGISSSSSHDASGTSGTVESTSETLVSVEDAPAQRNPNISNVLIGDQFAKTENDRNTLNIHLLNSVAESPTPPPPLPDAPLPSSSSDEGDAPMEAQLTPQKKADLLRFILDDQLETSNI
ncbi:Protein RHGF-2 [Aphelenchoides avenae]|nr:Protein RHGF-2 [Aphelenchus avenae]